MMMCLVQLSWRDGFHLVLRFIATNNLRRLVGSLGDRSVEDPYLIVYAEFFDLLLLIFKCVVAMELTIDI